MDGEGDRDIFVAKCETEIISKDRQDRSLVDNEFTLIDYCLTLIEIQFKIKYGKKIA